MAPLRWIRDRVWHDCLRFTIVVTVDGEPHELVARLHLGRWIVLAAAGVSLMMLR